MDKHDGIRYIDPLTDTGFKVIFGTEGQSEEILAAFLNELLKDQPLFEPIESVRFINSERVRRNKKGKTIIHDVMCRTIGGHRFILEMQKGKKDDFLHRSVYYSFRGVTDQVSLSRDKKVSSYKYMPVTSVFMCDFQIRELEKKLVSHFMLTDTESKRILDAGFRSSYIQLPVFNKSWEDCINKFDKWIYLLKNMYTLKEFPEVSRKDEIFSRLERVANYANLTEEERIDYEADQRWMSEYEEELATAKREAAEEGRAEGIAEGRVEGRAEGRAEGIAEGRVKGRAEGKWETANNLFRLGIDIETISRATEISIEELKARLK